ncbi:MAG: hypothetical protein EBW38_17320 [Rhodobacteraceae bacterium]|nr:hypothetical protein [Paracoccaceae bacterium]
MVWEALPIEGTNFVVRPLSGRQMRDILASQANWDEYTRMLELARLSVYDQTTGELAWKTSTETEEQPYPLLQKAAELALVVNGLASTAIDDAKKN